MLTSGGPRNSSPGTLNTLFFDAVAKFDKPDALQVKKGGVFAPISSRSLADQVRQVALGLQELGIKRGDRVAILSENRPEWAVADYAALTSGLTDVPLYPTLPAEQLPYLLNDSGAVAIFVSSPEQAAKIAQIRGECPGLTHVIGFGDALRLECLQLPIYGLGGLMEHGNGGHRLARHVSRHAREDTGQHHLCAFRKV